MSLKDFNRQVDALWAAHFGCEPAAFDRDGTTLLPRDHLRGENLIHIVYIRKHALAEFDPALETDLRSVLAEPEARNACCPPSCSAGLWVLNASVRWRPG